jgi:hypothetical protein
MEICWGTTYLVLVLGSHSQRKPAHWQVVVKWRNVPRVDP